MGMNGLVRNQQKRKRSEIATFPTRNQTAPTTESHWDSNMAKGRWDQSPFVETQASGHKDIKTMPSWQTQNRERGKLQVIPGWTTKAFCRFLRLILKVQRDDLKERFLTQSDPDIHSKLLKRYAPNHVDNLLQLADTLLWQEGRGEEAEKDQGRLKSQQ